MAPFEAEAERNEVILRTVALRKEFSGGGGLGIGRKRSAVAVVGADLEVRRGETLAIVGESGSGKSTLARLLLRLIEPTSGSVEFEGDDIAPLNARAMHAVRRRMQMIFQDPYASLHPTRTTFEIISEGWRIHRGIEPRSNYRARVEELLTQVGLPIIYADMYPSRLSGGERQRVAIARALALRPELLVLDEPVSALDVSIQAQVIQLLMRLQEDLGLTYVFISHDLALVQLIADRIVVMRTGEIVEQGLSDEVFAAPKSEYTRELLAASPGALVAELDAKADEAEALAEDAARAANRQVAETAARTTRH